MSSIKLLWRGLNVAPLRAALDAHSELWDQQTARTAPEDSPHHGLSDIWARFADPEMAGVRGERLGGVLITRIRPGQICKPHTDPGWHARYYSKFAVQIAAAPEQAFHFEGEKLVTAPGDIYWFDNSHTHWVTNESEVDRITMIVCIKTERI